MGQSLIACVFLDQPSHDSPILFDSIHRTILFCRVDATPRFDRAIDGRLCLSYSPTIEATASKERRTGTRPKSGG